MDESSSFLVQNHNIKSGRQKELWFLLTDYISVVFYKWETYKHIDFRKLCKLSKLKQHDES